MDSPLDDLRHTELDTLQAIFPEIHRPDEAKDPFTFEIELPVQPAAPVTVTFPAATGNDTAVIAGPGGAAQNGQSEEDSLQVSHLPSLMLRISLPEGYPPDRPPAVRISTEPPWLSQDTISKLESDAPRLWEEMGRDMVAYTYIDHVQHAADGVFGAISADGTLEVASQHKLAVLDHDIKAKKEAFEKETFDCGICLDPKKGSKCHKMLACGHVFCLQCLQDFYNEAIQEGNVSVVRCLAPNCAKERSAALEKGGKRGRKSKTSLSPSELLQIGLSEDTAKRYVMLRYKTELESDKNTIYCPRLWCGGAARSERHKKPSGLEFEEDSGQGSDQEETDQEDEAEGTTSPAERLAICEDCGFAFCSRCFQTWHGEFVLCAPKRDRAELTEEEKASLEYLHLHTSPCPTCSAPAQKTHGCNHMICARCDTHFCYLCSAWLDPGNPYQHYNQAPSGKVTSCYMRLWELEGGDGDDVGLGFVGGRGPVVNRPPEPEVFDELPDQLMAPVLPPPANPRRVDHRQLDENGHPVVVDREAPLVLRLVDNQANARLPEPAPARAPAPAPRAPAAGRGRNPPQRGGAAQRGQAVARGRGGRGGARAQRGRGRQANGLVGGPAGAPAAGGQARDADDVANAMLDAHQEAWVRHFVEMALLDAEDEIDFSSDGDDELFRIR